MSTMDKRSKSGVAPETTVLVVKLEHARDIKSKRVFGKKHLQATICLGKAVRNSSVQTLRTRNPVWDETFVFSLSGHHESQEVCQCYRKRTGFIIGRCVLI